MTARVGRRTPAAVTRARELVEPALAAEVARLRDPRVRRVAGYQLGLWDVHGQPETPGGKAVRPAMVLLAARAVGGAPEPGLPAAVAVELVHNFSLLHDDIMDRDVERRHRPTGWVAFGEGQAMLGGNAMMAAAVEILHRECPHPETTVPELLRVVQELISGQSCDLALEGDDTADLETVLAMEQDKTAALLSGSLTLGALAAGADPGVVERLGEAGRLVGIAFQLIDDVLGIVGDPAVTGKSASSDVRAGKRSAPVVAALRSGTNAGDELAEVLRAGAPETEDEVTHVVTLIDTAGGISWATTEAERLLTGAYEQLDALDRLDRALLRDPDALNELRELAGYLVRRDR